MKKASKNPWKLIKLKDVCLEITVGHVGSMANEYVDEGIPFLRSQNILPFTLNLNEVKYISAEFHKKLKKSALKPGDVGVIRTGYPGTACVIPQTLPIANCADLVIIRPSEALNPYYLSCIFNSTWGQGTVEGALVGVAQQHFNVGAAKEMFIHLPPLLTQKKIVYILSTYGALIENNTRRIKILEEMAHRLYHEWFVNFRFAGYQQVPMVESELGLIPQGWEVKNIGALLSYHIGGGWGQEEADEKYLIPAYVIRGTDIPSARYVNIDSCPLRFHTQSNFKSRKLNLEDIVFEVSGGSKGQPVGRALLISQQILSAFSKDVICASFCKLMRANTDFITSELFYLMLIEMYSDGRIEKHQVQSTGITNFKFTPFLEGELAVVPSKKLQTKFNELIHPVFELIQNLGTKNSNLRKTRDLLLPKLISGEIDVESLDPVTETNLEELVP